MPPRANANLPKSSRAGKKSRELEKNLKALRKQEENVKRKLTTLECSIVAQPALLQERRLRNWNTLPPPDDTPLARRQPKLPRVRQEMLRQARAQQAVFALFLVTILIGAAMWFLYQLRVHHLLD